MDSSDCIGTDWPIIKPDSRLGIVSQKERSYDQRRAGLHYQIRNASAMIYSQGPVKGIK
jgi:hypothetical protein